MTWGWTAISKTVWRYDATWTVEQDWVSHRWYAHRNGNCLLCDFADAGGAMAEADRLRIADRDYAASG